MSKYFVFQQGKAGIQTEIGRKKRGAGRPPVGEDIVKDDDGNVYISNCLTTEPHNVPEGVEYVNIETDDGQQIWYKKSKPASRQSSRKYKVVNGKLVDEGAAGRGRPAKGYVKVESDKVIDGVNIKGHFLFQEEDEVEASVPVPDDDFEDVEIPEDDEDSRAAADALADIEAEGEAFEDIDEDEYEVV